MTEQTTNEKKMSRRQSIRDKSRTLILDTAREMFLRKGYEETKIRDLAKAMKRSTGLLFTYFPDKLAIWEALFPNVPAPVDSALTRTAPELLAAVEEAAAQFRFYEEQHRAKGTPEADKKAEVNNELATRLEALALRAKTRLPFELDREREIAERRANIDALPRNQYA